jgi:hypothetical protein
VIDMARPGAALVVAFILEMFQYLYCDPDARDNGLRRRPAGVVSGGGGYLENSRL